MSRVVGIELEIVGAEGQKVEKLPAAYSRGEY